MITLKAYAKINIGLDVTGKREDGYHLIKTVMQQVDLYDIVSLEKADGISFETNSGDVPVDDTNLACKAARIMMDMYGVSGVRINLDKRIPVAAGMAGGSTDGAAVLVGINELYELGLTIDELCKVGVKLGADIPFCIKGGCALCEGIGEIMTDVENNTSMYVLVTKPNLFVSTPHVYKGLGLSVGPAVGEGHPDIDGVINALRIGDTKKVATTMGNYLEKVTASEYDIIEELKHDILMAGALGSNMSGSGPTVFGLFDSMEAALAAEAELKDKYPDIFVKATGIING